MTHQSLQPIRPLEPRRSAIVIGASSGIGAALTRELAHRGYNVAAVARREAKLNELCQAINAAGSGGSKVLAYTHSVTRFEEAPALFQAISDDLGGLDLIAYVAGVMPAVAPNEYNFEKDLAMVQTNLLGAMAWLGQAAVRFERAKSGQIVGISSIAADRGRRLNPGYNSSKAGLDTYLEALRNRLTQHGVTVTTIKPGFVDTAMLENSPRTTGKIPPDKAAALIYRAVQGKKQVVYVPGRWRYVSLVIRNIPSVIFRRLNI